jgi:hypothetical protein
MCRAQKAKAYEKARTRIATIFFVVFLLGGIGMYYGNIPAAIVAVSFAWLLDYSCELHYLIVIQKQEEMKMRQAHWARICAGEQMNPFKAKDS